MSDFKPKPNTANLFHNDVGDNPKRPNWKTIGIVTFNGVEGYVSGWSKTASNGNEYISIVFEEKEAFEAKRGGARPQPKEVKPSENKVDGIPF